MAKTNFEFIKEMALEDLAKILLQTRQEEEIDYDWDENPYIRGIDEYLETSDGILFDSSDYAAALEHEVEWLKARADIGRWKEILKK